MSAGLTLQHVNVKLFAVDPAAVNLEDYSAVFNAWIQAQDMDELLVDVADYRHVHHGPGILLIGHEADYGLDNTHGRLGLLYNRKAPVQGRAAERLAQALATALRAARRLEQGQGLRFNTGELLLFVNDRLIAPNNEATLAALQPALDEALGALFGGRAYSAARNPDPRERFSLHITTPAALTLEALLANIDPAAEPTRAAAP